MSAQKESHSTGAVLVWAIVLAPVLYVMMYLPLLSLGARSGSHHNIETFDAFYRPLPRALYGELFLLWCRIDRDGEKALYTLGGARPRRKFAPR